MKLHFDAAQVIRLLDHAKAAPRQRRRYDFCPVDPAGLWLVGDQGVYLMSNGDPALPRDGAHIAYAREVDPTKLGFDEWWAAKRASFGGDDGCEFLDARAVRAALLAAGEVLPIDVTPTEMRL